MVIYILWLSTVYVRVMVFDATFNNISVISWRSVLLVEETRVPRENRRPVSSQWQTLSHNVVSSTHRHEWGSNSQLMGTDCPGSCKSSCHMITTTHFLVFKVINHHNWHQVKWNKFHFCFAKWIAELYFYF